MLAESETVNQSEIIPYKQNVFEKKPCLKETVERVIISASENGVGNGYKYELKAMEIFSPDPTTNSTEEGNHSIEEKTGNST